MNCISPATPGPTKVRPRLCIVSEKTYYPVILSHLGDRMSQCRGELHRNPAYSSGDPKANGMTILTVHAMCSKA